MNPRTVTVTVETTDPDTLNRAVECLARAITGLALEDIPAYLSITTDPEPDTENEETT